MLDEVSAAHRECEDGATRGSDRRVWFQMLDCSLPFRTQYGRQLDVRCSRHFRSWGYLASLNEVRTGRGRAVYLAQRRVERECSFDAGPWAAYMDHRARNGKEVKSRGERATYRDVGVAGG